mmetsp:Transcript_10187/g.30376  ORF Transcript_10187/g.30376 Transcript_10187/m.30376 type:complete len:214 (+) Transcript_10187:546-1187(+)
MPLLLLLLLAQALNLVPLAVHLRVALHREDAVLQRHIQVLWMQPRRLDGHGEGVGRVPLDHVPRAATLVAPIGAARDDVEGDAIGEKGEHRVREEVVDDAQHESVQRRVETRHQRPAALAEDIVPLVLLGRGARLPCEARDGVEVKRSQRRRELLRALLHRDALAVLVLDGLEAHAHVMAAHGDAEGSSERVEEAEQKLEAVDVQLALHEIGH